MNRDDDDEEVRIGYVAREQERRWLAGPERNDEEWMDERVDPRLDDDEREARERMKRKVDEEYNRNRFGIEDDDRVGRVWGGDDDFESEPTGVIRTAGLPPPSDGELRYSYIPGRARMGRDGDEGPGI